MKLKKDGLVAGILEALVEEERKKVAEKRPDIAYNQKKQLWYLMMNQVDGVPTTEENKETT